MIAAYGELGRNGKPTEGRRIALAKFHMKRSQRLQNFYAFPPLGITNALPSRTVSFTADNITLNSWLSFEFVVIST